MQDKKHLSYRASAIASARDLVVQALSRIDEKSAYSDILTAEVFAPLSTRDKRLATAITYGVLRYQNQLDWYIEQVSSRGLAKMTYLTRAILRSGVYQLLFLDRVPPSAVINEAVKLARYYGHKGIAGFVNAVLRQLQRNKPQLPDEKEDPVRYISLSLAHPEWMVRRWINRFGIEECKRLCQANNQQPRSAIRLNTLKISIEQALPSLGQVLENLSPSRIIPEGFFLEGPRPLMATPAYQQGFFEVQGLSSMLVARILNPQPGELVLDACAGRGGKTTHLAQLMENRGILFALDTFLGKLQLLQKNARKLGVRIVREVCADVCTPPFRNKFDRILIDAPCSSLGVIRRHPEIKWVRAEADLTELSARQLSILEHGSSLLIPKGLLLYSTCSLEPEETEQVAGQFLERNQDFTREDIRPLLPKAVQSCLDRDGYVRIYPHRDNLDGFFIAGFKKRS